MRVQPSAALVTGGASGLGAGVVKMVVEGGRSVAILNLPNSEGCILANRLGPQATFLPCDVTQPTQITSALDAAADWFGWLNVCVTCAGLSRAYRMLDADGAMYPEQTMLNGEVVWLDAAARLAPR